ncbi:MAG: DUF4071 domain-containing protein [Proteobacteria bacterium]|nr:DUF4071 domain-containing protein [Pseudomonadota bacterium]
MATIAGTTEAERIRGLLDAGLTVEALDLARKAAGRNGQEPQLLYLAALACVRLGALREAKALLRKLQPVEVDDARLACDIQCLAGRIAKERFAATRVADAEAASGDALEALDHYRRALAAAEDPYPAINAATMAFLCGDQGLCRTLANRALAALPDRTTHWAHATAGEACLHLGRQKDAARAYAEAHRLAGGRFGDIASIRRQLVLIGTPAAQAMLDIVVAPTVIAFTGHMIDHPQRARPRFPAALEDRVAQALRERLERMGPVIGYAQAACGADILFLEALQAMRMQTHVVLPFARSDFVATSVTFAGGDWERRFDTVLERATSVVLATEEPYLGDDVLFEHAANLIHGMALLRADELVTEPMQLTVREPGGAELVGGAEAVARLWSARSSRVENIDIAALRSLEPPAATATPADAPPPRPQARTNTPRELRTLMFADLSGFTSMPEQYTPDFVQVYLGIGKAIIDRLAHPPLYVSTRGDGLFMVFAKPSHAAEFALALQEDLRRVNWPALGLAQETSVRIGLHTGPVFATFDPIMDETTYYGTHVNLTARLEPIVQPGQILGTEAFAASLTSEGDARFRCDYVGAMSLARRFSEARLFRLHRAAT